MAKSFIFSNVTKQGKVQLAPGVPYGFEDPDAIPYFSAMGWGEESDKDPVVTITLGEFDIDPETVFADGPNKGQLVIGGVS